MSRCLSDTPVPLPECCSSISSCSRGRDWDSGLGTGIQGSQGRAEGSGCCCERGCSWRGGAGERGGCPWWWPLPSPALPLSGTLPGPAHRAASLFPQIAETYAFLPREAVTRFLMSCTECQKRMHFNSNGLEPKGKGMSCASRADTALRTGAAAPAAVRVLPRPWCSQPDGFPNPSYFLCTFIAKLKELLKLGFSVPALLLENSSSLGCFPSFPSESTKCCGSSAISRN